MNATGHTEESGRSGAASKATTALAMLLPLVILLLLGAWPFLSFVGTVPVQPDSLKWIEEGAPGSDGWSTWVFHSSHFVGYRPLTAISFTWDMQLFGFCATGLRMTDLALHLAVAGLVFLIARRLAGVPAALLATLLFVAHPCCDEVVPFLARRSYSIAAVGALTGLLLGMRAARRGVVAFLLTGPALLLGMFGNELGATLALALPVVAWAASTDGERRRAIAVTAWGWAWIVLGVLLRQRVMGEEGGYPIEGSLAERAAEVLQLYGAALPGRLQGPGGPWTIAIALVGSYYALVALWLAIARPRDVAPIGLLATLAVYGGIVASQGVWFPRQVYPAVAIGAVLAGVVAARTLKPGTRLRGLHALPQLVLCALVLHDSPILHGPDDAQLHKARVATRFVRDVQAAVAGLDSPARVYLVAPLAADVETDRAHLRPDFEEKRSSRAPAAFHWMRLVRANDDVRVICVAYVKDPERFAPPSLTVSPRVEITFPQGATCYRTAGRRLVRLPDGQRTLRPRAIDSADSRAFVWLYPHADDATRHGRLVHVHGERERGR